MAPPDRARQVLLHVPLALTATRAVLGPALVLQAIVHPSEAIFGICLVAAFLSDVFDGIIARRLGIATVDLRRLDSIADSIFYVCAVYVAWHLHEAQVREYLVPLAILLGLELVRYVFDYLKFRREASYHMWSSKAWGVALFVGFFCLLALGISGWPVGLAIYVGIVTDLEGLAVSATLRTWRTDVPSIFHAFELRRSGV